MYDYTCIRAQLKSLAFPLIFWAEHGRICHQLEHGHGFPLALSRFLRP